MILEYLFVNFWKRKQKKLAINKKNDKEGK